jgi:hypothetical protein
MSKISLSEIYNNGLNKEIAGNNDKGSIHSYIMIYEKLLSSYRSCASKFLEIGVAQGYSLRMWNEYFNDQCEVKGIDISKAKLCDNSLDVTLGDSKDAILWLDWDNFDVIIDDGDHNSKSQMQTAEIWLPKITDTGIYIIEDVSYLHTDLLKQLIAKTGKTDWTVDVFDMRELKSRIDNIMVVITKNGVSYEY